MPPIALRRRRSGGILLDPLIVGPLTLPKSSEPQLATKAMTTLDVGTRQEWRNWLQEHHASVREIWLVFYKRHTGQPCISYDDAVAEALCFGWIDSLVKRIDDARYARKFTPRKPDSRWSTINRRRYQDLEARGLLAPPGLERPPTERSGDAPRASWSVLPPDVEERLKADTRAWEHFQRLPPSRRRAYIGWIVSAKRPGTREKRIKEATGRLAAGKELGLK